MKIYSPPEGYPANIGYILNQVEEGFIRIGTDKGAACEFCSPSLSPVIAE